MGRHSSRYISNPIQRNGIKFSAGAIKNYTTSWYGWAHYWGTNDTNGIKFHIHNTDARMSTGTNKLVFLDSDRNIYIDLYVRTLYQTSDERLKRDIRPLRTSATRTANLSATRNNANTITDMVMKLTPVTYRWKDEAEFEKYNIRPAATTGEIGFLAQDVAKIIPGAVAIDEEGNYLINYNAIIPVLTGAIQELTERVTELEAKLANK